MFRANGGDRGARLHGECAPGSDAGPPGSDARWLRFQSDNADPRGEGFAMNDRTTSVLVADGRQMVAETLERVIDAEPDLKVVGALTERAELLDEVGGTSARAAIVAGCLGVISKDRGTEDLCNAIRSAARCRAVASVSDL